VINKIKEEMEEIKKENRLNFRVWDKNLKTMDYECSYYLLSQTGRLWSYSPLKAPVPIEEKIKGYEKNLIVLQCTGQKDKNGKLIFEGDIVRGDTYPFFNDGRDNYLGNIYYWQEEVGFALSMNCINPKLKGIACGGLLCGYEICKLEVIGNIYENPELLKPKHPIEKIQKDID
jgi:uncharacterized phage protein (TIGR01671 family)